MAVQTNAFQGNDGDLLARMRRFEDHFVERKTVSDRKDWLKTIVAFANSTPDGSTSVLFIGVTNEGVIEDSNNDHDAVQKTLNKELEKAYPRIQCQSVVIAENGRQALAIIVPSSKNKPHFAGPAFVRRFSETFDASEQEFNELIARRNSKVSRILDYKGRQVTVINSRRTANHISESYWPGNTIVYDCDQHYLTLATGTQPQDRSSFSLAQVEISFDHSINRLLIKLDR
jgi:Schlafen, AlbA_2